MKVIQIDLKTTYCLVEFSCPPTHRPSGWIMLNSIHIDIVSCESAIQALAKEGWHIYSINDERIKAVHMKYPIWEAIYLRDNIN